MTTIDENGQPHDEIVEEFEGDEELRPLMAIPDISVIPPIPDAPALPGIDLQGMFDTIPPPAFPFRNAEEWQEFSKTIDEQMRRALENISALRDGDAWKLMEELDERVQSKDWPHPFLNDSAAFENLELQLE